MAAEKAKGRTQQCEPSPIYAISLAVNDTFARMMPNPSQDEINKLAVRREEIFKRAKLLSQFLLFYGVFDAKDLLGFGFAQTPFY
jgi:hypothetical protein